MTAILSFSSATINDVNIIVDMYTYGKKLKLLLCITDIFLLMGDLRKNNLVNNS